MRIYNVIIEGYKNGKNYMANSSKEALNLAKRDFGCRCENDVKEITLKYFRENDMSYMIEKIYNDSNMLFANLDFDVLNDLYKNAKNDYLKRLNLGFPVMDIEYLDVLQKRKQVEDNVVYYSHEFRKLGNKNLSWLRLYDKNFNFVKDVILKCSNALNGLIQIVRKDHANDMIYSAYVLTKINNEFYTVEETEYTSKAIKMLVSDR